MGLCIPLKYGRNSQEEFVWMNMQAMAAGTPPGRGAGMKSVLKADWIFIDRFA